MRKLLGACGLVYGECPAYGCATLTAFFEMVPPARESLEALRVGR